MGCLRERRYYDHSSIAWTRLPVFIFGVIAGKYIDAINFGRLKAKIRISLVGGVLLVLIVSLVVFPLGSLFTRNDMKFRVPLAALCTIGNDVACCPDVCLGRVSRR